MKRGLKIIIVNLILMAVILAVIEEVIVKSPYIWSTVTWEGRSLSGLTQQSAAAYIENETEKMLKQPVTFRVGKQKYSYTGYELGFRVDNEKIAKAAWSVGRQGFFLERWQERKNGKNLKSKWIWSKEATVNILADLGKIYNRQAQAATVRLSNEGLKIEPSKNGRFLDTAIALTTMRNDYVADPKQITLPLYSIVPFPSTAELKSWRFNEVYGAYSTYFNQYKSERSANIAKAAACLNGTIIYTGAIISFNDLLGPRTWYQGYQKAPIFRNGKVEQDYGGGVCQVASTLYATVMINKADFKIIERHAHSLPVSYITKGLDAAVSYGYKDLKFQYTGKNPLLLCARAQYGALSMEFRGLKKR